MIFGDVLEGAIEVECRGLALKTEKVKLVEKSECRARLRLKRGCWPPRSAQELPFVGDSWIAAAEVNVDEMDPIRMKNDEILVAGGPPLTY
jgi:hypothetical protein